MANADQVKADISDAVDDADFVQRLAARVGVTASASAVFGEPVERGGITVIPVAKASWGFGGGSGGDELNTGSGGGGGSIVSPIGFIEVRQDDARFVRITDLRLTTLRLAAVAGVIGWIVSRR